MTYWQARAASTLYTRKPGIDMPDCLRDCLVTQELRIQSEEHITEHVQSKNTQLTPNC